MTTHLQSLSDTFLTLCGNFEPECQLTGDIWKTDCAECKHTFWDRYRGNVQDALRYGNVQEALRYMDDPNKTQVGGDQQPGDPALVHFEKQEDGQTSAWCNADGNNELTDNLKYVTCRPCVEAFENAFRDTVTDIFSDHASDHQVGGDHYTVLDVQPWDAMASWVSPIEFEGFLRCNAIKYLARAGAKGSAVEDYRKARHYLDKLIEVMST